MSRIGNRVLAIPSNVEIKQDNNIISIKGQKGELKHVIPEGIEVTVEGNEIKVTRKSDLYKPFHGTTNALISNMLLGVTEGYVKGLEIVGVGYKFQLQENKLIVQAGYSKPVEIEVPEGIEVEVLNNTEINIKGINKELVGEFAANVRKIRKPEPYKGKGIKYKDEKIRRKEGKKAA
jgi:ribosomal protein L6